MSGRAKSPLDLLAEEVGAVLGEHARTMREAEGAVMGLLTAMEARIQDLEARIVALEADRVP